MLVQVRQLVDYPKAVRCCVLAQVIWLEAFYHPLGTDAHVGSLGEATPSSRLSGLLLPGVVEIACSVDWKFNRVRLRRRIFARVLDRQLICQVVKDTSE